MKTNIKLLLIFISVLGTSFAQDNPDIIIDPMIGDVVNPLYLKNSDYTLPELPTADIYHYEKSSTKSEENKDEKTLEELRQEVNQSATDIRNALDSVQIWAGNPTPYAKVYNYDAEALNYKRFESSPCFSKLGFSPFRSPDEQERMYQTCESEYYKNLTIKIASSLLIFGFIAYMIYTSLKRKKKTSSTTNIKNDVEDKL